MEEPPVHEAGTWPPWERLDSLPRPLLGRSALPRKLELPNLRAHLPRAGWVSMLLLEQLTRHTVQGREQQGQTEAGGTREQESRRRRGQQGQQIAAGRGNGRQ